MKYAFWIYSIIMTNYDFVYFLVNIVGFNSPFCRWIEVEITNGGDKESNVLSSSFETEFSFASNEGFQTKMVPFRVSNISDTIACESVHHNSVILIGFLILLSN
jgi:hypothetical protein